MASDYYRFDTKGGKRKVPQKSNLQQALDPQPIRARLSRNGGISGSKVRVTNPAAAGGRNKARTASLGMGAVAQRGRNTDVGAAGE